MNASSSSSSGTMLSKITRRPPGARTRAASARNRSGFGKWWGAKRAATTSNSASEKGMASASPRRNVTLPAPQPVTYRSAATSIAGVRSRAQTSRASGANARAVWPPPVATSRTRSPPERAATPVIRSSSSPSTWMRSRTYRSAAAPKRSLDSRLVSSGDDTGVPQGPQLVRAAAQQLVEDLVGVLAEHGRRPGRGVGVGGQHDRPAGGSHPAQRGVLDLGDQPARRCLRVLQHLRHAEDRRVGDVIGLEDLLPLGHGVLA